MRTPRAFPLLLLVALVAPAATVAGSTGASAPAFANYASDLGIEDGEPSVGIDPDTGQALMQVGTHTLRATFDDASAPASARWDDVTDPAAAPVNFDPILYTDPATGRTWAGGLEMACSVMSYSDDAGAHWSPMVNPCAPPGVDHETIASGPWHEPRPLAATYPRAVYYCVHEAVEQCATSLDGGVTFLPPVTISPTFTPLGVGCGGYTGKLRVAPDGSAFVTSRICTIDFPLGAAGQGVMVSQDNGLTWTTHLLPAMDSSPGFEPAVATTPSSWVYAAWTDADSHIRVALSKNHASTWSAPTDLAALAGLASTTFATVIAGDDARAAVAFAGTTTPGNAFNTGFAGTWDLYVATTTNAGASWSVVKATTDPIQRGWVCTGGINSCTDGVGRNMLDFITATTDAKGRIVVAYADGCVGPCAAPGGTVAMSASAVPTLARQNCGPSLFAAQGDVQGSAACPTGAPPTAPVPWTQSASYAAGQSTLCGASFHCASFAVPAGAASVHVEARDDVDPHVGLEVCMDDCATTIFQFCDASTMAIPAGTRNVIVNVNTIGAFGVVQCGLQKVPGGEATSGTLHADFA